ncbi:MAG: hypothetical protein E7359_03900 [Clostridiales bacterium]|nr:hypothetical protein [Clostridiales bacterium]
MNLDLFYSYFIAYLTGLIEDDPIPYEIKSLVFFINSNNEIGFSGSEEEDIKIIDLYFYFPLEAEYFDFKPLYNYFSNNKLNKIQVVMVLKSLLIKLKKEKIFQKFNIYFGLLFDKAKKI